MRAWAFFGLGVISSGLAIAAHPDGIQRWVFVVIYALAAYGPYRYLLDRIEAPK